MKQSIVRDGVIAGLLAAVAVALWFLLLDSITRVPFFTPAALFSALFRGATSPDMVEISMWSVGAYTLFHAVAFVVIGLVASGLVHGAQRAAPVILIFVEFFVAFQVAFFGWILIFAEWVLGALGWWSLAVGNLIAASVIVAYFWQRHPELGEKLRGPRPLEEEVTE